MGDEDAAHGLGGCGEEVAPTAPILRLVPAGEPEVGLVDEGRRLEGLAGPLAGQLPGGQPAQFVADQREEPLGRLAVALLAGGKDAAVHVAIVGCGPIDHP
jgi:hypothetical protein